MASSVADGADGRLGVAPCAGLNARLVITASADFDARAVLARKWLRYDREQAELGVFTLRPAQRAAVTAVQRAFDAFGGALVADPPGTGKTIIALAVSRGFAETLVAAPAVLRAQWHRAAEQSGVRIRFMSLESLSRGAGEAAADLVIVDEAHHVRTPGTHRYRHVAGLCARARVLLLTATPVVNRRADRDALLALFLGARATTLDESALAKVIVRRERERDALPSASRLAPLHGAADVPSLEERLRTLPAPLPTADGTDALALLRVSLAMAWGSSLAALDAALRRRLQRGESLADALAEGRWPDRATLRHWIVGDDATQLAMPLLLPDTERPPPPDATRTLATHLEAVRAVRAVIRPHVAIDTATRADALRDLVRARPGTRVIAFAHHAESVRALLCALRGEPGIVAMTGDRVRAAHGRWNRNDVLRAFGPRAPSLRSDDPRAIRLLLATDLMAEGVELQGAGVVVHLDTPWTPARLEQRVGRAARLGGASLVHVARFALPRGARSILQLEQRLRRKARARHRAVSAARAEEMIRTLLTRWIVP